MSDAERVVIQSPQGTDPSSAPAGSTAAIQQDGVVVATANSEAKPAETPQETPKKFAGKYDTPEALEQAYVELQKKLGQQGSQQPNEAPRVPTIETSDRDAAKAVEASGLDIDALSQEFARSGALSADSMAKLQQHGMTKDTVEKYVKGQLAVAQRMFTEVAEVAGGADQLNSVIEWAAANANPDDIQAYNDAVATKNLGVVKLAVGKLVADYTKANGRPPKLVTDGEATVPGSDGPAAYKSSYEVTQAMRDPRYAKDPAYREEVYRRLAKTQMFGA